MINVTSKNDLAINCSIINSHQLAKLKLIQLQRENASSGTFDTVISMANSTTRQIKWFDKDLENRSSADGTLEEAELRLFIGKESVRCFHDFTKYKCKMYVVDNSQETDPVTASPIDTCTCMYVYIKYDKSDSIEAVCEFNE